MHGGNDDLFELPLHSEHHREDSCKPHGAVAALWLLDRLEIAHRLWDVASNSPSKRSAAVRRSEVQRREAREMEGGPTPPQSIRRKSVPKHPQRPPRSSPSLVWGLCMNTESAAAFPTTSLRNNIRAWMSVNMTNSPTFFLRLAPFESRRDGTTHPVSA